MWRLTLKNLRANLTRLVSTVIAVVAGTAFVATGLVLTQAIGNAVAGNVEVQYGAVDAAVTARVGESGGGPGAGLEGVDAEVLTEVQSLPEVSAAVGELAESTKLLGADGAALRSQMLGRTWITDDQLNPFTVVDGRAPTDDGEIAVDRETAERHDVRIGQTRELATPSGLISAEVVGITGFGESASVDGGGTVFFSPAEGLDVLGAGSEQYSQLLVRTDGSESELVDALRETVPRNVRVESGTQFRDDQVAQTQDFLDFLRPLLLGFAFLALFVAGFVIYNTFTVVVTQRSRELALIRSIGGTPGQVRRSLLGEGLVLGAASSLVGLGVGTLMSLFAQWLLRRFDAPIPSAGLALNPWIVVVTLLAGTVITVLSVMIPAFRAGRTRPVEAMRSAEVDHSGTSRLRMYIGGTLLVVGIVLLLVNRFVSNQAVLLGGGALLLFWGVVVGGPLLARLFGRLAKELLGRSLTGRLASDNMVRNPKRTSTTANALVIGLFLVTLVTVSGTAFRDWAMAELAKFSSSDFVVVGVTPIPDDVVADISDIEGVEAVAPVRTAQVTDATGVTAQLSGADVDRLVSTTDLTTTEGSLDAVAAGEGAATADINSLQLGTGVEREDDTTTTTEPTTTTAATSTTSPTDGPQVQIDSGVSTSGVALGDTYVLVDPAGEEVEVPVVAVLEVKLDTLFLGTLVNDELFTRIAGDQPVGQVFVRTDQDRIDAVGTDLDNLLEDYTGLQAVPGNFIGQIFGSIIDFFIAAVNGLLGLSVLIALVGIVNTMNLSIHERRRELGMVRALGMTKSQVRSMVRTEAFMIGILGTVIGMVSGVFLGWVVVGSVTDANLPLDWARIGLIFAAGVVISVLASLWPARRSVQVEMLEAMAAT